MCRFCPPDPELGAVKYPVHVAPCNCRMHRDDLTQHHIWVGDVKIDADTGEVLQRVEPMRRPADGVRHNDHVSEWLYGGEGSFRSLLNVPFRAPGRPDLSLPVPF